MLNRYLWGICSRMRSAWSGCSAVLRSCAAQALLGLALTAACAGVAGADQPQLKPWTGANPAPDIDLKTLDGQPFRLHQMRGKVVLVNFWATWCEPCVEEMPSLQKLRDRFARAPFEIIAVNLQEGEPRIRGFLKKVPVTFPIVRDTDGAVTRTWQARVFPTSYLIDAEGRIRYVLVGATDWSAPELARAVEALLPREQRASGINSQRPT